MTEYTPPGLSVEGQEAILLMPIKVLTSDYSKDEEKTEEHDIKTTIGIVKHTIRGTYCSGREGLQEMLPRAVDMKAIIDRYRFITERWAMLAPREYKNDKVQYGELPPRQAHDAPWSDVAVDLIGPWTIRDENGFDHEFRALTIIDTVSNYSEIIRIKNKTAEHVAMQFENNWLARYPKPNMVIMDPGSEFKGKFREMLAKHGIEPVVTSVKHPQGNSICERLHQTVADVLRPLIHSAPPQHAGESADMVDTALATAAYATRTALHATLGVSPGMLAFNRDMLLDIPILADLKLLRDKRQVAINNSVSRANKKRVQHDYRVGDMVLRRVYNPTKLEERFTGPYPVDQIFANGTISIKRSDIVSERLNLRKIKPYNEPNVATSNVIITSVFDL